MLSQRAVPLNLLYSADPFAIGRIVKNLAGRCGRITDVLDDGKAVVDWEGQINGDVMPLHLLRACD